MDETRLRILLAIWALAVFVLFSARAKQRTVGTGLVAAYVLSLMAIHAVAALLYLQDGYDYFDRPTVIAGLEQSTYAVVAFAFSSLVLTRPLLNAGLLPKVVGRFVPDPRLPLAYVGLGVASFTVLLSGLHWLPSATAIVGTGQQLSVAGLALCCWYAWKTRNYRNLMLWLSVSGCLPFITMTTMGYIGYGAFASLLILIFASGFVRSRMTIIAVAVLASYVGLSIYVTYMRDRSELRQTVWSGGSYSERLGHVGKMFSDFELFDLSNSDHMSFVDERMNQSYLVGLSVARLADTDDFARGKTLWQALQALVPRVLWPEKPSDLVAGSGTLVTHFTGIEFAEGTSVGIGHVMEFYVNFGTIGVVIGFLLFGLLVTVCDIAAADRLAHGDLHGFMVWFLPGISFLNVGGSFIESTTSLAASIAVATAANIYLSRMRKREAAALARRAQPAPEARHAA